MRRVVLSYLVCFSLLVLNPALPQASAQDSRYQGSADTPYSSGGAPDYWATPPDRDMAQSYPPPPANGNPPYGNYPDQQQPYGQQPNAVIPDNGQGDQEHGVARLSIVDGEVNVRRGDTGDAVAAAVNAPLLTQDRVQTSPNGRAEVELDAGNVLRLAPNTDLGFADLRYRRSQVQLGLGTVLYRDLRPSSSDVEIDTPSVGVRAGGAGEFRISVYDDGTTQVTVRSGQAEVLSANGREELNANQSLLARGDASHPEFQFVAPPAFDQLEGWSRDRDRQMLASQSYRYVNPDIYGADDLDRYGSWVASQYGQVWQPQQPAPDWAPYSSGDWSYEPYYGWTWVDTAPWGWAPYHYGRWFVNGSHGWCWWPGGVGASAFWSPAMVGFFGIGAGLGWVALAPFELFHPWWGFGFHGGWGGYRGGWGGGGWGGYRNAGFRGGAIFAARGQFGLHTGHYGFVDRAQLVHANFINGRLPVSPVRSSYAFSNRSAFSSQRIALAENRAGNRPFFHAQGQTSRGVYPGSAAWGRSTSSYGATARGGFGSPSVNRSYEQPHTQAAGGWHSFGDPGRTSASASGRQNFTGQQSSEAWHSFGQAGHGWPQGPSVNQQRSTPNGQQYGQSRGFAPSYSAPRSAWGGNSRSAGNGFGSFSTPHSSNPRPPGGGGSAHYSQPHASPSYGGGGGHSSGGGGHSEGGGHSSGGGGHHR